LFNSISHIIRLIRTCITDKYVKRLYVDKEEVPPHLVGQKVKSPPTPKSSTKVAPIVTSPVKSVPTSAFYSEETTRPKPRTAIGSTGSSQLQRTSLFNTTSLQKTNSAFTAPAPVKPNIEVSLHEEQPDNDAVVEAPVDTKIKKKKKVPKGEKKSKKKPSLSSPPSPSTSNLLDFNGENNGTANKEQDLSNTFSHLHVSHSANSLVNTTKRDHDSMRLNKSFDSVSPKSAPIKASSPFDDDTDDSSDEDIDEVFSNKKKNVPTTSITIDTSLESKKESILSLFNYSPSSPTASNQTGFNNKAGLQNSFF
jgi:hypothetical protein